MLCHSQIMNSPKKTHKHLNMILPIENSGTLRDPLSKQNEIWTCSIIDDVFSGFLLFLGFKSIFIM